MHLHSSFLSLLPSLAPSFPLLSSRAQGEVSIREALRELEMWGAGSTFSLTPYTDSAAKEINIIRDWKELVNQVLYGIL